MKLLSPRTSKVSTKQKKSGSTYTIHFKELFVAYCYKHTVHDICDFVSENLTFAFRLDTYKLQAVCRIYGLVISSTVYNTGKIKLIWRLMRPPLEGALDIYKWKLSLLPGLQPCLGSTSTKVRRAVF